MMVYDFALSFLAEKKRKEEQMMTVSMMEQWVKILLAVKLTVVVSGEKGHCCCREMCVEQRMQDHKACGVHLQHEWLGHR